MAKPRAHVADGITKPSTRDGRLDGAIWVSFGVLFGIFWADFTFAS